MFDADKFMSMTSAGRNAVLREQRAAKPTRGRPVKPAADIARTRTIRLTDADYAELMRRGVDRLRKWLRRKTLDKP